MAAYIIAEITVTDPEGFAPLRALRESASTARAIAVMGCGPAPQ